MHGCTHLSDGANRVCAAAASISETVNDAIAGCQMAQLSAFISAKKTARITMLAISHNSTVNMKTMGESEVITCRHAENTELSRCKCRVAAACTEQHKRKQHVWFCVLTGAGGQS